MRLRLIESQKRLPLDHPGHPNNHSIGSTANSSGSADVVVSPGVTAEKLMYDRALEMSRTAAINELTSEDLAGCEIAYVTAIRMLEAVLEDDGLRQSTGSASQRSESSPLDSLQGEDRQVVVKSKFAPSPNFHNKSKLLTLFQSVVSSMRTRLGALRKKLAILSKRSSAPTPTMGSAGRMPSSNLVPVSQATPPR